MVCQSEVCLWNWMNVIPLKNVIDIELWDGSIPNDNICFQACPSDTLTIRTVLLLALDKSLLGDRGCVLLWYGLQHMVFL